MILIFVTIQILVVLLIGERKFLTNQNYYPDLVVTRHQYGISALVSQTSLRGETSDGVAKCRLFSQAKLVSYRGNATTFDARIMAERLYESVTEINGQRC